MSDIIDANVHLGPSVYEKFEFEPTIERLIEQMDDAGIDEAIVSPLKPPSLNFDEANAELATRIAEEDRLYGIGRIDPRLNDASSHVDRAIGKFELHGIRLHPWEETYSISSNYVTSVIERAKDHNVPVWIHAGYPGVSHALSIREVVEEFPGVEFVLTHGAQLDISGLSLTDALLLAEETTNTLFDLSGVYRRDLIQDLVETAGPDRVVFGSNAPYFHPKVEKSRISTVDIDEESKIEIFANGKSLI